MSVRTDSTVISGAVTRRDGTFRLDKVPIGRYTIRVSCVGYEPVVVPGIVVTSGKEVVLPIALVESFATTDAVLVTIDRSSDASITNSEYVSVSGRTFRPEETRLYPGSIGDPARMAQNFAGVIGANDARNDIVVRGNSPLGMLYQMEGMNIPNPSHYGALSSSGGVVSMLNNNILSKSDFLTSAFPTPYGNALSGVFDLRMRSGNEERSEFIAQVSFNGFEFGAEGPMWDGSSYAVNYRYSTLAVFNWLGIDVGVGSAIPYYQDVNFKVTSRVGDNGAITVFGTAGISNIDFIGDDVDTARLNAYAEPNRNIRVDYASGWTGAYYEHTFSESTYGKILIGTSFTNERYSGDSLDLVTREPYNDEVNDLTTLRWSTTGLLRHRVSSRLSLTAGFLIDGMRYDLYSVTDKGLPSEHVIVDTIDNAILSQAYAQAKWRLSGSITLNAGLHAQMYSIGNSFVLGPRLGLSWQIDPSLSINAGYGLHAQTQNIYVYNIRTPNGSGGYDLTNRDLGFTTSQHLVLGADWYPTDAIRFRAELYSQWLNDAPVERTPSSYSALNTGADFFPVDMDSLVNSGTGNNYGVELTLEQFMRDGAYFLVTGSLFSTTYRGSDNVERNTAFNTGYVFNVVAGKEFKVSLHDIIAVSARMNTSGGRYLTPIDLEASQASGTTVYDGSQAYSVKQQPYFRLDIRLAYRIEFESTSMEIAMDLMNVTDHDNIYLQTYDPVSGTITTQYQQGFIPVPTFRWTF